MADLFSYNFVWLALLVSFLVSICSGIIGSMIVANKNVFVAGGVAHSAFGGVGLALFCGFSTMLGAMLFGVIMALFLSYAFLYQRQRLDAYVGASWAFGMAIGVILIDLTPGYSNDISSYLFGSILAVGFDEIIAMAIFDIFIIIFVSLYYYKILNLFYDSEFCALKGMNINLWTTLIFVCIAIGVVISMNVAGLILVLAILSIPAYIANLFTHSLRAMMWLSWLISLIFMWLGFFVAYWYNISVGACIVVLLSLAMFFAIIIHKFTRRIL
ncbi:MULTISPECIES: metal ABC transporter permease [Helicobacter]|uniref:Metal ABC transporter permease n=11 Tax=Helicobacter typhlonius TaxID=76936 RepID=A0A099UAJ9_9HELI|nr:MULTISPECIES: metal ABC transporter permease [Helicobacter]TLD78690.1 metal ABC transporter permease [Helicobacter typhlonius]TLD89480.1 metal ABC transporter permease [Helicobacter sp. MIT 03-1616]CUU40032.1 Zinc ABC transporter, inner membrane permease protein ZnuB [Helicobacter typhlonius]